MHAKPRYHLRVEKVRPPSEVRVGATFPLPAAGAGIGRDPSLAICLPDDRVSRRHARVSRDAAGLWLERESRHAVWVNQQPVAEDARTPLRPLDWVQVGGVLLRLYADDADTASVLEPITIDVVGAPLAPTVVTLELDRSQGVATLAGHTLGLRPGPFAALAVLAADAGRWVSSATLVEGIWAGPEGGNEAYVTKYVSYLRTAIGQAVAADPEAVAGLRARVRACADAFTRRHDLDDQALPQLLREFVKVRTKVGYRLHLRPDDIVWKG